MNPERPNTNTNKVYTVTTTWPDGWDATAEMRVDIVTDHHSQIQASSCEHRGGASVLAIVDQGDAYYTLAEVAEALGLCGALKECHLLVSALRQYAAVREALSLGDATSDREWTPYTREQLDPSRTEDYSLLCDTVAAVFGAQAGDEQRAALSI